MDGSFEVSCITLFWSSTFLEQTFLFWIEEGHERVATVCPSPPMGCLKAPVKHVRLRLPVYTKTAFSKTSVFGCRKRHLRVHPRPKRIKNLRFQKYPRTQKFTVQVQLNHCQNCFSNYHFKVTFTRSQADWRDPVWIRPVQVCTFTWWKFAPIVYFHASKLDELENGVMPR